MPEARLHEFDRAPGADHPDVDVHDVEGERAEDVVGESADDEVVAAARVAVEFHAVRKQTERGGDVLLLRTPCATHVFGRHEPRTARLAFEIGHVCHPPTRQARVLIADTDADAAPDLQMTSTADDDVYDQVLVDSNADGYVDAEYVANDGDRIIDTAYFDTNFDGVVDEVDMDTDRDGVIDTVQLDLDGDGNPDWSGHDVDGDGYADEIAGYSTVDGQWHPTPGADLEPVADDVV